MNVKLLEIAENRVTELFENVSELKLYYHNYSHSKSVVEACKVLAKHYQLSEDEINALLISAWFHDVGYVNGKDNHEEKSIEIVTAFLKSQNQSKDFISKVSAIINATKFDVEPKNLLEQIICDADHYHLSKTDYFEEIGLLRKELKENYNIDFSDDKWNKENIDFLTNKHHYYTEYAIENWQPKKMKNLNKMEASKNIDLDSNKDNSNKKKKKKKRKKLGRGVETLFRVTINNHTRLSDIADSKANILLSVNAIIISVALSVLIPKLDSPGNNYLTIPTFTLLFFSVLSIIFAILSTRPKVTSTEFEDDDVANKKVNLLFFGNFHKIDYSLFDTEIKKMMKDNDYLYGSLSKDLHYLGKILDRKYRLLRITYTIFMIGIIVSVLTFIIAYKSVL